MVTEVGRRLQVLNQARALQLTHPDIHLRRARLLAATGRTREARAEFHELLVLDPRRLFFEQVQEYQKTLDK